MQAAGIVICSPRLSAYAMRPSLSSAFFAGDLLLHAGRIDELVASQRSSLLV